MASRRLEDVPTGEMGSDELAWLERVARRLPGDSPQFGRIEDERYGVIYFATKLDSDRMYHGVWGCRGTARWLDFEPDTEIETVRQVLVNDAAGWVESMVEKGLLRDG